MPGAALGDTGDHHVGIAAPQPVRIGEVGKAGRTAAIGAMAGGAVVEEQVAADVERGRVCGELGRVARAERRQRLFDARGIEARLGFVFGARRPVERALEGAHARIEHQIADAEDHGDDEQPQPPARQRIVEFFQIFVPHMPGGVSVVAALARRAARPPQQPQAAGDVRRGEDDDEEALPESHGAGPSSSSGKRAAASKSARRRLLHAQTTRLRNSTSRTPVTMPRNVLMSITHQLAEAVPRPCR